MSWYQEVPHLSLQLITECAQPPAAVIDIGGGASTLVNHLLERDYRVGVLDISREALVVARERLAARGAAIAWMVADITSFVSPEIWDVWHDRAVFHFLVDPGQRSAYLEALASGTRPGLLGVRRGDMWITLDCPMSGHGRDACVSLEVDDVDAYYAEWRDRVPIKREPHNEDWGARTFDLVDPFGNTIFVMGPIK